MNTKTLVALVFSLSALVVLISLGGICIPETYIREMGDWRAQSLAQDWFDLVACVPLLVVSMVFARRGSKSGFFFLVGALMFIIYTLIIYAFAVPFNRLFLLYCIALGAASYALIYLLWNMKSEIVKSWFDTSRSTIGAIIYLVAFAALFLFLWLSQIIPAIISGEPPPELLKIGLLTNPVHVLDLSFLLPGFILTAWLLHRGHSLAYVFAPAIMTFSVVMTLSIGTLVVYEYATGFAENYYVAIAMLGFAVVSWGMFRRFMTREEAVGSRAM